MTPAELDEQIAEYDVDEKNLGFVKKEEWIKNYSHYLDLYFSKWSDPSPEKEITGFLKMMKKMGFLPKK